jgi:outer membrane immunogenic protein
MRQRHEISKESRPNRPILMPARLPHPPIAAIDRKLSRKTRMRPFVVALCSILWPAAGVASDLAGGPPPPVPVVTPTAYDWTGFYVGAQTGWLFGDADASFDNDAPSLSYDPDGFVIGGHAGYNRQFGRFVAGLEADAEWSDADGSDSSLAGFSSEGAIDLRWQGSVRARFGAAFDRLLVYATAGGAYADAKIDGGPAGGPSGSFDDGAWGWTVGAGAEAALTARLLARLEYRYSDFADFEGHPSPGFPGVEESVDLDTHVIHAGISWKF